MSNDNMPERIAIVLGIPGSQAKFQINQGMAISTLCTSPENAAKQSELNFTEYVRADLVPKWISVSEMLPEHSYQKSNCYDVACKNASAKYTGCAFIGADARWYSSNGDRRKGVTHWRERPEYPTEGK